MGERKIRLLTPWQRSYILGQVLVDKERQKVEDYYLRKVWRNLDVVLEDFMLLSNWAEEKRIETTPEGEVFRIVVLGFRRGRKPSEWEGKRYRYDVTLKCPNPHCGIEFSQVFWVSKNGVEKGKPIWTFGLPRPTNST